MVVVDRDEMDESVGVVEFKSRVLDFDRRRESDRDLIGLEMSDFECGARSGNDEGE